LQEHRYGDAIDKLTNSLRVTDSPYVNEKALGNLGLTYSEIGEFRRAVFFSQKAELLAIEINGTQDQMKWLIDLGREHFHEREDSEAQTSFSKALVLARGLHDDAAAAICLHDLTQLAFRTKDLDKAEDYIHQLAALRPTGAHYLDLVLDRAELAKEKRDFAEAEKLLKQLLEQIPKQVDVEPAVSWGAQSDLASLYAAQGKFA